jgi:hypothetical protein
MLLLSYNFMKYTKTSYTNLHTLLQQFSLNLGTNNLTWLLDVIVNIVLFGNAPLFWNINIYVKVSMTMWTLIFDFPYFFGNIQLKSISSPFENTIPFQTKKETHFLNNKIFQIVDCLEFIFNLMISSHLDQMKVDFF